MCINDILRPIYRTYDMEYIPNEWSNNPTPVFLQHLRLQQGTTEYSPGNCYDQLWEVEADNPREIRLSYYLIDHLYDRIDNESVLLELWQSLTQVPRNKGAIYLVADRVKLIREVPRQLIIENPGLDWKYEYERLYPVA